MKQITDPTTFAEKTIILISILLVAQYIMAVVMLCSGMYDSKKEFYLNLIPFYPWLRMVLTSGL